MLKTHIGILVLFIFYGTSGYAQKPKSAEELTTQFFLDSIAPFTNYFEPVWQTKLDSLIRITPNNAYLWQQKAMPCFKARKYEVGMEYLDRAVALDADYTDYRAFMKCIFSKNYRDALVDFQTAVSQKGNAYVMDHRYSFYEGLCYLQLNEWENANVKFQEEVNHGLQTSGVHYVHWLYLGIVQYELGQYVDAEISLQACLKIYPQLPDAQYYLMKCYRKLDKADLARKTFIQAKKDYDAGYRLNEDNAIYELYPYQCPAYFFR